MSDTPSPGMIRADEAYTLAELERRLDLGKAAMRQARRNGLAVRRVGRKRLILGADLLKYIEGITPEP